MANHNAMDGSERVVCEGERVLWTRELMFKVIDAVKEEPLLWNPMHVDYKHRLKRKAALNRVAAQLQLPSKVIEDGLKMDENVTWADVLGSYVSLEVKRAGERPDTEMRQLHRTLIRVMEEFRGEGEMFDTEVSSSAINSP